MNAILLFLDVLVGTLQLGLTPLVSCAKDERSSWSTDAGRDVRRRCRADAARAQRRRQRRRNGARRRGCDVPDHGEDVGRCHEAASSHSNDVRTELGRADERGRTRAFVRDSRLAPLGPARRHLLERTCVAASLLSSRRSLVPADGSICIKNILKLEVSAQ